MLVVIVGVFVAGCTDVNGSGNVVTESRNVEGLTSVELAEDGNLYIEQNETESLTITADDNLLEYLRSDLVGSRLVLDTKGRVNLDPTAPIVYKLTVKSLDEIRVSGDGSVDAKGIHSERLKIKISGDGGINIAGSANEQEIRMSGDGSYNGQNLSSKAVRIDISGDGGAILAVSEKLDANLSGDGSVEYIGSPAVTQRVSGDGSIRKRS